MRETQARDRSEVSKESFRGEMGRFKPTYTIFPPASVDSSKVVYKGDEPVDDLDTEVSLAGSQFAQFIFDKAKTEAAETAAGLNVPRKKEVKDYPAFRNTFFADTRFTPALSYTHLSYEFDAQFGEMNNHWKRAGKKFSDEPARGKPQYSAENGPKKPTEWPKYAERETRVYGAKRKIMPFSTSKKYTAPLDRCTLPYKPTPDEAVSHLGPGTYKYPDPWMQRSGDGNIAGTQAFLSRSRGVANKPSHWDKVYQDEPTMVPGRPGSRAFHRQITGSFTRTRTPADFSRSVINKNLTDTSGTAAPGTATGTATEQPRSLADHSFIDEKQGSHKEAVAGVGSLTGYSRETPVSIPAAPVTYDSPDKEGDASQLSPGGLDDMNDSVIDISMGKDVELALVEKRPQQLQPQLEGVSATDINSTAGSPKEIEDPVLDGEALSMVAPPHGLISRALNTLSSRGDTRTRNSRASTAGSVSRDNPAEDFLSLGTTDKVQSLQYLSSSMSDPQLFKFLVRTQFRKNAPGQGMAAEIRDLPRGVPPPKRPMSVSEKNKIPGVTIGRGKPGKSSLDIITGSTDADKKYRRLNLKSGKRIIYKLDRDSSAGNMPDGAEFTDDWGITDAYAEKDPALSVTIQSERAKKATLGPPSPKARGSLAGPAGVIGRDGPIWVEKTRPSTVSVAHALPATLSGPKTLIDAEKWMPPRTYRRTLTSAQGARARNQAQADADFPLRGFPAHLKQRLQDSPNPASPQGQAAIAAGGIKNSRGILAKNKHGNADSLGTLTRVQSSHLLDKFLDADSLTEKFEP